MIVGLAFSTPVRAADPTSAEARITQIIDRERKAYGPPPPKPACKRTAGEEIVVCGRNDGAQWRVPPTSQTDPRSRQALHDGLPRAPNVSGLPECTVVKCRGFGRVPAPVYYIDLKSIPEAPADSDADLIGKGEMAEP